MRIVDADKLLHKVKINAKRWAVIRNKTVESIIDKVLYIIEHAETVDAEPVRHGKWIMESGGGTRCSYCNQRVHVVTDGSYAPVDLSEMPYCPKCGAKMDEVK